MGAVGGTWAEHLRIMETHRQAMSEQADELTRAWQEAAAITDRVRARAVEARRQVQAIDDEIARCREEIAKEAT